MILNHSHQVAIVVLPVIFFLSDNLREKEVGAPEKNSQVLHVLQILSENRWSTEIQRDCMAGVWFSG